jgi:hypothetical protein
MHRTRRWWWAVVGGWLVVAIGLAVQAAAALVLVVLVNAFAEHPGPTPRPLSELHLEVIAAFGILAALAFALAVLVGLRPTKGVLTVSAGSAIALSLLAVAAISVELRTQSVDKSVLVAGLMGLVIAAASLVLRRRLATGTTAVAHSGDISAR